MRFKYTNYKKFIYPVFCFVLLLFVYSSIGIVTAQKKPTSLKLDSDSDDKIICQKSSIKDSQFCDYYDTYYKTGATEEQKMQARNEMIELVRGQVDTYYKMRKDGRKTNIKWLQTIFDILEVGAATAISITNGERAKTVVGAALSGFQGGRTAFNKNFEILQTQVLINTMAANRANIFTEIAKNKPLNTGQYSWYAAKNDLRRYLLAGTFNNALDTLVKKTGSDVDDAEEELRVVENRFITAPATENDLIIAKNAFDIEENLETNLGKDDKKANALEKLQNIIKKLEKDEEIEKLISAEKVSSTTADGIKIIEALDKIKQDATRFNRRDIVRKINSVIIELGL